jgi:hypothetical protein
MTDDPTALVINLELRLAYCPLQGRMWRTDARGRPGRELMLWCKNSAKARLLVTAAIRLPGLGQRTATRVIYFMMTGAWPPADMFVDHRSRDVSDNRWTNLRLCTVTENNRNIDRGNQRWNGIGELIEQGVQKTLHGSYIVQVCGVYYGCYRSRVEANQECRRIRREVKGEYDVPFKSWRRIIRGTAP